MSTFIFDIDGTLCQDNEAIPGARETLATLRERGHRLLFATNDATRSRHAHIAKLISLGFTVELHTLITSAYSTGLYLQTLPHPPHSLLVIGSTALCVEIALCCPGVRFDGASPIDTVVVSFDPTFSYHRLAEAQEAVFSGARLLATNRDPMYPGRSRMFPGAGALVSAVETACQTRAYTVGKPSPEMYRMLMLANNADPATTIVVGDSLLTDIAAAVSLDRK